jgi:hypothetical protein
VGPGFQNWNRASRRPKPILAFPAKAGIHSSDVTSLSSKRDAFPTDERLVPRNNGPRLPPGKRVNEHQFFHALFRRNCEIFDPANFQIRTPGKGGEPPSRAAVAEFTLARLGLFSGAELHERETL